MCYLYNKVSLLILAMLLSFAARSGQEDGPHIILISVDGLRPDAVEMVKSPNFSALIKKSTYFKRAQTIQRSETLPSHTSMVTGVSEYKHGVDWNYYKFWRKLEVPTCFEFAKKEGFTTAMFLGKDKLRHLIRPNSLNYYVLTGDALATVLSFRSYVEKKGLPNLSFLHFKDPDESGHKTGWMTEEYLKSIESVDVALGNLMDFLKSQKIDDSTFIILTGDHGGHGFGHYPDPIMKNLRIPWIISGPGVAQGLELFSEVHTYDTAATILNLLGLPIPSYFDGRPLPVKEASSWKLMERANKSDNYSWCIHSSKPEFSFKLPSQKQQSRLIR